MNKSLKFAVLTAGVVGLVGFFLPLLSVTHSGLTGDFSTYSLVSGIDKVSDHFPGLSSLERKDAAEAQTAVAEMNTKLKDVRMIFAAVFVPSALLLLWGILGIALARFGRGLGALSLLSGLAALAIYALIVGVIGDLEPAKAAVGLGAHLVAASGALGVFFGVYALVKPDRGGLRKGKRFKATIASRPPQI